MEFRVLGPLEVRAHGRAVALGGAKQRAVLGVLLLHANEVVSTDRLVDELWGDRPPKSASKLVQGYVGSLRRVLNGAGDAQLLTRAPGYVLHVADEDFDLALFERLLEQARVAAREGDARHATALLRNSLGLWRGPALSDLALEAEAAHEAARLDELRLAATLERIELELELRRHTNAVADLEALVAAHPLEERARALLMLALYRSGRQARALEVYREGREALSRTLGLEPSADLRELERGILRQDPALGGRRPTLPLLRSRRRLVAAVVLGAALAAVAAALWVGSRGGQTNAVLVPRNAVGVISPDRNAVIDSVPVGVRPTDVAVGEGAVWVLNSDDRNVARIDPLRRVVERNIHFGRAIEADRLAVGAGSVWVPRTLPGGRGNLSLGASLERLDPQAPSSVQTIPLVRSGTLGVVKGAGVSVAADEGAVWAGIASLLARVDPRRGVVVSAAEVQNARDISLGEGSVWILNAPSFAADEGGTIHRFSPATESVVGTIQVGTEPTAIAVGLDGVWVSVGGEDAVVRVDPATNSIVAVIPVGAGPTDVAVGAGAVWVANGRGKTVSRIDPKTNEVTATIPLGNRPDAIAVGAGAVWVTVY